MDKYFVTPETGHNLKLLGFAEKCLRGVDHDGEQVTSLNGLEFNDLKDYTSLPMWVQALDWFVEKHSIHGFIVPCYLHPKMMYSYLVAQVNYTEIGFDTPEEAYQACVNEIIDIILARKYESESNYSPRLRGQEDCGDNIREQDSQQ